ncbi:hypothetical protein SEA_ZADA_53 [Microbacterium phage Zada]|uniref:Uncharacterized protein n=1 Tax=Microbacterium phage Zada TaxID=2725622 RepID=A0A6M3TAA7_9CAUD|nr:hypothetical protein SEA_ZADA_53 [Microbacterium phage Zada]
MCYNLSMTHTPQSKPTFGPMVPFGPGMEPFRDPRVGRGRGSPLPLGPGAGVLRGPLHRAG